MAPDTHPGRPARFVVLALALFGLIAAGAVAMLVSRSDDRWVAVGAIDRLRSREIVFLPELDAYVVTRDDGSPLVLLARSPQMGEPVRYCASSGWFEDPAHGSKFDGLGRYALGPAPRGLDRLPISIRAGLVLVDPTRVLTGPARTPAELIPPIGPFCTRDG